MKTDQRFMDTENLQQIETMDMFGALQFIP